MGSLDFSFFLRYLSFSLPSLSKSFTEWQRIVRNLELNSFPIFAIEKLMSPVFSFSLFETYLQFEVIYQW